MTKKGLIMLDVDGSLLDYRGPIFKKEFSKRPEQISKWPISKEGFEAYINKLGYFTDPEIISYSLGVQLGTFEQKALELVRGFAQRPEYELLQATFGAEKALRRINQFYDFLVVTSREECSYDATRRNLELRFGDILQDSELICTGALSGKPRITKGEVCVEYGATHAFDDSFSDAREIAETTKEHGLETIVFLQTQKHNGHEDISDYDTIIRVNSLPHMQTILAPTLLDKIGETLMKSEKRRFGIPFGYNLSLPYEYKLEKVEGFRSKAGLRFGATILDGLGLIIEAAILAGIYFGTKEITQAPSEFLYNMERCVKNSIIH